MSSRTCAKPVVSVGGAPSSGTTLLADLLDSTPRMACDPELGILSSVEAYRWESSFASRAVRGELFPSLSPYSAPRPFFNSKYYGLLNLDRAAFVAMVHTSQSLPDFVDQYRRYRAEVRGRPIDVMVEKTPTNVATAGLFLGAFPHGIFVHVIRDPREVVGSLVHRGMGLAEATAVWLQQTVHGARLIDHPRVITITYAELVASPFESAATIAAAVGLLVDPDEIRRNFETNEFRASLPRVKSWRVPIYEGTVAASGGDRLSEMDRGWVERQSLWNAAPESGLSFVSSVAQMAHTFGIPAQVVPKARFTTERLDAVFKQFSQASEAYDQQFVVTDSKDVVGCGTRLSKSSLSDWRKFLDSARPWIPIETLEQIGVQAAHRHRQRRATVDQALQEEKHLRVLHGVTGAANQPSTVSRFQRDIGLAAQCVTVSEGGFGYESDLVITVGPDRQASYSDFLRENVDNYDVFHFYFRSFFFFDPRNNAFPSGLDLLMLRAAGKTVVVHFRGSEVRDAASFRKFSPFNYVDENPSGIFSKFSEPAISQRVDFIRSVANAVLVPDEELQSYVPDSRIVRRAIDLDDFAATGPTFNERPLVVHAPSRRAVKGSDYVLAAVKQLQSEGLDFDFRLIEGLPHREAKQLYAEADVVIDQLRIGWFGVLALEGMALGKCVLAYVREDLLESLGEHPPLLATDPTRLASDLRTVIESPDLREKIGKSGRRYVEENHDARLIARELELLYQEDGVVNSPIDVGGVLDYLLVQRNDTKGVYRKKFSVSAVAAQVKNRSDLLAEFRRVRSVRGSIVALGRVAKWASNRAIAVVRGST